MSYLGALITGMIISIYFCYERRNGFSPDLLIFKTVSSICFLLCGFVALAISLRNDYSFYGPTILFGGILCLCGDVFLDLKGLYEESKDKYMNSGFIAFFVAHIFYNIAIIKSNNFKWWQLIVCLIVSLIIAFINISLDNVLKIEYGKFKLITFAYSAIMILTTVNSIAAIIISGFSFGRLLMLIGGIFFLISDVILSYTFFKKGCDGAKWYVINHVTYYIAQYAIMSSICVDYLIR